MVTGDTGLFAFMNQALGGGAGGSGGDGGSGAAQGGQQGPPAAGRAKAQAPEDRRGLVGQADLMVKAQAGCSCYCYYCCLLLPLRAPACKLEGGWRCLALGNPRSAAARPPFPHTLTPTPTRALSGARDAAGAVAGAQPQQQAAGGADLRQAAACARRAGGGAGRARPHLPGGQQEGRPQEMDEVLMRMRAHSMWPASHAFGTALSNAAAQSSPTATSSCDAGLQPAHSHVSYPSSSPWRHSTHHLLVLARCKAEPRHQFRAWVLHLPRTQHIADGQEQRDEDDVHRLPPG